MSDKKGLKIAECGKFWYIFIENKICLSSKFMLFLESLKQKQKAF